TRLERESRQRRQTQPCSIDTTSQTPSSRGYSETKRPVSARRPRTRPPAAARFTRAKMRPVPTASAIRASAPGRSDGRHPSRFTANRYATSDVRATIRYAVISPPSAITGHAVVEQRQALPQRLVEQPDAFAGLPRRIQRAHRGGEDVEAGVREQSHRTAHVRRIGHEQGSPDAPSA